MKTSLKLRSIMIQLLHFFVFFSLTAKVAHAGTSITARVGMMTLSDQTSVMCCHKDQNVSRCSFYSDSRLMGQQNTSSCCCELMVSGQQLLESKAGQQFQTAVNVHCKTDHHFSPNVTITVWRLHLSGIHTLIVLVMLGIVALFSFFTFIISCIICVNTKQGRRGQFEPARVDPSTVEEQEEITEKAEDEIFYATVNHSASCENFASAVKFESGTEYATVVIN